MQSIVINAPEVKPLPFGLLSVADVENVTDPHELGGFEYESVCGHRAGFTWSPCNDLTGATAGGANPYPASVTITSDIVGDYVITWGQGSPATDTVTFTSSTPGFVTTAHSYTTTGNKTVTVVGPLGYGTRTIVLNASTTAPAVAAAALTKTALSAYGTTPGEPVTMLAKYECTPVGADKATQHARAMAALTNSDDWSHERAVLLRHLAGATVDVTGGVATTPNRAVALLENYAAVNYAGVPVIHVDRFTGAILGNGGAIGRHGTHLETVQGALVASGAGYSSYPIVSDTTWAYVTGRVLIKRGQAQEANSFTTAQNVVTTLMERTSVISVECIVAKAKITTA